MAHTVESRVSNPAGRLRDDLARAERLVVNVSPENVEELLLLLDSLDDQFSALEAERVDLRAERGRWESILRRLNRSPAKLVAAANRAGGLSAMRARHAPAESFWWQLDQVLATRRRRMLLQTTMLLGGIIGGLLLVYWLINTLFPPDPAAVFMVDTNARLEAPIREQDWTSALQLLEEAKAAYPDEVELYLWEATIADRAGEADRAAAAAARAQDLMADDPIRYWVVLADHQLRVGDIDRAEQSIATALEMDETSAQGHFLLAEIAELRGEYATAVEYFDKAYELALDEDNQLAAMARIRMANALQRIGQPPMAPADAATDEP
jgi:tetratricopeptide (TPR) repeat protein